MSACEKCWADAFWLDDQPESYRRLLTERTGHKACTPQQQAGPGAAPCAKCNGALVRHQITGQCMVDPRHTQVPGGNEGSDKET